MDNPNGNVSDQADAAFFDEMAIMQATNLVRQLGPADTFNERKMMIEDALYANEENMQHGPSRYRLNMRDLKDNQGKIMFSIMAIFINILPSQLVVDSAQAGGMCGASDGCLILANGCKRPIEIKGTKTKKGKKETIFVNGIRLKGTDWQELFIVTRKEDPDLWTDFSEYPRRGVRLAHVSRAALLHAADIAGKGHLPMVNATITPGSKRGWLGPHINWVRAEDLSREWWDANVLRGALQ